MRLPSDYFLLPSTPPLAAIIANFAIMNHRNDRIAIVKGLAIILMVIGHAEAYSIITNFIYLFHMPVFFIAAGYFFKEANLQDPYGYVKRRAKGLYLPFVKWALFFLVIHNLMFSIGILNEEYGNVQGGVTHPYNLSQFVQRFFLILFSMGGYDEFLAGAFWFFRALLVVSVVYLILTKLLRHFYPRISLIWISAIIGASSLVFAMIKIDFGLRIPTIVQGGIRETWGLFFFSMGPVIRTLLSRYTLRIWQFFLLVGFLCVGAFYHWKGMNLTPQMIDVLTLPLTGLAGFLVLDRIALWLTDSGSIARRFLTYCGVMTLYIYVFHIIAFKAVSLIKIWWFSLDPAQIGCHMVIHDYAPADCFWILYSIAGVALPLACIYCYNKVRAFIKSQSPRPATDPIESA